MSNPIFIESEEKKRAGQLKRWLETEAKFYSRTDEEFLLMFVRGCKHDMEKAKKKMYMYYEVRKKIPHWWSNRDIHELERFFQLKGLTVLPDNDTQLPAFGIIQLSKCTNIIIRELNALQFDKFIKMFTINMEITIRRTNCQKTGFVGIVDFTDYPLWVLQKAISPIIVYNFIHGFYTAMPLRLKQVHFFNFPWVGRAALRLFKSLLPPKMRNRVFCYGSDLTALKDNIDNRLLPEEYRGPNGSLVDHEEAYLTEVFSYSNYFSDDIKYGFQ